MSKKRIYLDDVRTPTEEGWIVVRNYDEFVEKITEIGLNDIETISLDHDLGDTAMEEYFKNVGPNYTLDYNNIKEKTGLDCAKWLINHYFESRKQIPHPTMDGIYVDDPHQKFVFPTVYTHSANPIGSGNIMGYVNNFFKNCRQPQTCIRVLIKHTIKD